MHQLGPGPRDAGMPKATQWVGWGLGCFPGDSASRLRAGPPCAVPVVPAAPELATLREHPGSTTASQCPARPVLEGHLTFQTSQGQASHASLSLAHLSPAWMSLSPHANSGCAAQPVCLSPGRPANPSHGPKNKLCGSRWHFPHAQQRVPWSAVAANPAGRGAQSSRSP